MKLYVNHPVKGKLYLGLLASTRADLMQALGSYHFTADAHVFSVDEVFAEATSSSTQGGALAGGLIGVLGGPIGIAVGGLLGGLIGNETDKSDVQKAVFFNNSKVFR